MQAYTYSINNDFPNHKVSLDRLALEIQASAIATTLDHMDIDTDACMISFVSALSSGDVTLLNGLVAAHSGNPIRDWVEVRVGSVAEPVVPGATKVVANDRPAIEIEDGVTGFAAVDGIWPLAQASYAELRATIKFIMQATGTGSAVRLALKAKAQATGEDSSAAFPYATFKVVAITYTTLGQVFEGQVVLEVPAFKLNDALAVQYGRDGANGMGAGTNDDANQAIQIIALKLEAR